MCQLDQLAAYLDENKQENNMNEIDKEKYRADCPKDIFKAINDKGEIYYWSYSRRKLEEFNSDRSKEASCVNGFTKLNPNDLEFLISDDRTKMIIKCATNDGYYFEGELVNSLYYDEKAELSRLAAKIWALPLPLSTQGIGHVDYSYTFVGGSGTIPYHPQFLSDKIDESIIGNATIDLDFMNQKQESDRNYLPCGGCYTSKTNPSGGIVVCDNCRPVDPQQKTIAKNECICDISILMTSGCKCGFLKKDD